MLNIPIYKAEKGLEELILQNNSVAYLTDVKQVEPFSLDEKFFEQHAQASKVDDLVYMRSLLASAGWNDNQDVFDIIELWNARHSPKDKPVNVGHDFTDIVGHMTASVVVDDENKIVADSACADDLPNSIHVIDNFVLYKIWPKDPDKQERMDELLQAIAENKKFVSMECLFTNFDYALAGKEGIRLIQRNKETAFLTKYIRAYGGKGEYNGEKVGRVFRNLIFNAKGIVDSPANPKSKFLTSSAKLNNTTVSLVYSNMNHNVKESVMSDTLEKQLAEANTEIKKLQAALAETGSKAMQAKIEDLEAQLKVAKDATTATATELQTVKSALADKQKEVDGLAKDKSEIAKQIETIQTDLSAAQAELKKSAEAQKKSARVANVVSELKLDQAEAKTLVDELFSLSDESFSKHVERTKKLLGKQTVTEKDIEEAAANKTEDFTAVASQKKPNVVQDQIRAHYQKLAKGEK